MITYPKIYYFEFCTKSIVLIHNVFSLKNFLRKTINSTSTVFNDAKFASFLPYIVAYKNYELWPLINKLNHFFTP